MANTTKKYISLDKLTKYHEKEVVRVNDLISTAKSEANAYADSLAPNYDAAGAAATVQGNLDSEIARAKAAEEANKALAEAAQSDVDALAGKVGEVAEGSTVVGMIDAVDAIADANAADIVTMKGQIDALEKGTYDDTEVRNLISGLDTNKADKTQVATDIAAAVKVEEEDRIAAVQGVQDAVDTLSDTHATDKKALEDAIALKADQTALDDVSAVANAAVKQSDYNTKVAALEAEDARIAGLVSSEAERAAGVESGLDERLAEVEAFFKLAEGEQLDTALDTLKEIQDYVTGEGAAADQMVLDIAANKKAIEDHIATNHDFAAADDALKSELNTEIAKKADATVVEALDGRVEVAEGKIATVEGKVSTLEGQMTTVQGAVATKVEQEAYNAKIVELEGADADFEERIEALEGQLGESGDVATDIATAKQEAIDAAAGDATSKANQALADAKAYADEEDAKIESRVDALETASGTHALASDLTALAGRVTTAEGKVATLESEMDAVEAKASANETAIATNATNIAKKADATALTAATDRITILETWHNDFIECSEEDINNLF